MTEQIKEYNNVTAGDMVATVMALSQSKSPTPLVFRQVVSDWPVVNAAKQSNDAFCQYLSRFDTGVDVYAYQCDAKYQGRFFYDESQTQKNFTQIKTHLRDLLSQLLNPNGDKSQSLYMGSTTLGYCLGDLQQENTLPMLTQVPLVSIWLGNQTEVAAHYDVPENIACVVAGKRQFTLFAPELIDCLYPGPIDFTPAGQIVSMVDFTNPDYVKFPKYKEAQNKALRVELLPGDAIYIPSMWWHHVKSTESINGLINYWWRDTDAHLGLPTDALKHAILSISQLPHAQRQAWRAIFEHYVFSENNHAHINEEALGSLGNIDDELARKLRWQIIQQLNN
ncbi:cupin [Pseudoalteromonas sp. A25]|uniref:cupin-like domain-containing protein n=1 Tax=Pseudoalteromonas sp. A25 TaxID=116092 RepID=UPI001260A762|nr:cupin-like domain-containing protein [Pseudoalteromonas sp. A25]BBN81681.1 cupin [Pseudoalteromonas sp. A25]